MTRAGLIPAASTHSDGWPYRGKVSGLRSGVANLRQAIEEYVLDRYMDQHPDVEAEIAREEFDLAWMCRKCGNRGIIRHSGGSTMEGSIRAAHRSFRAGCRYNSSMLVVCHPYTDPAAVSPSTPSKSNVGLSGREPQVLSIP